MKEGGVCGGHSRDGAGGEREDGARVGGSGEQTDGQELHDLREGDRRSLAGFGEDPTAIGAIGCRQTGPGDTWASAGYTARTSRGWPASPSRIAMGAHTQPPLRVDTTSCRA